MAEVQLGRMQFRIMQVLWDRGRASARDITDAPARGNRWPTARSRPLLRQLEAKGAVGHVEQGRTFVFFPRLKEDKVKRTAARDLLERVFGGSAGSLVAHLLKEERLSRTEIEELHRLIEAQRKT